MKEYGLNYKGLHIVIYKLYSVILKGIGLSGLRTRRALRERRALRRGAPSHAGLRLDVIVPIASARFGKSRVHGLLAHPWPWHNAF